MRNVGWVHKGSRVVEIMESSKLTRVSSLYGILYFLQRAKRAGIDVLEFKFSDEISLPKWLLRKGIIEIRLKGVSKSRGSLFFKIIGAVVDLVMISSINVINCLSTNFV